MSYDIYKTKGGEMIDEICAAHYGDDNQLKSVLKINEGLESQPFFLPPFLEIKLPKIIEQEKKKGVTLW